MKNDLNNKETIELFLFHLQKNCYKIFMKILKIMKKKKINYSLFMDDISKIPCPSKDTKNNQLL
jgi:hypothetical protein